MNISFLKENIEEIVKINDVLIPPSLQGIIKLDYPKYKQELLKNQEDFNFKYRHGYYSKENESEKEENDRLFEDLFKKHPGLRVLNMDSLDVEDAPENDTFYSF